jgi:hypothetical protein
MSSPTGFEVRDAAPAILSHHEMFFHLTRYNPACVRRPPVVKYMAPSGTEVEAG